MTTTTAHPGYHLSKRSVATALAGAAIAAGAGFGVASLVLDEATPATSINPPVTDTGRDYGSDPNGFTGTDREERSFMHRHGL